MRQLWLIGLFLFMSLPTQAEVACFKVQSVETGRLIISQGSQCGIAYSPASTFKVFLSLVGYQEGLLKDEHMPVFPYIPDSHGQDRDLWKQDTDPLMWMQYSNVWYSQRLVGIIGHDKVAGYVNNMNYGNKIFQTSSPWLDGTLQITPDQQLAFLSSIISNHSGFKEDSISRTKILMDYDFPVNGWQLFGKTGTMTVHQTQQIGWYVGWLTNNTNTYSFVYLLDKISNDEPAGPMARTQVITELAKLVSSL